MKQLNASKLNFVRTKEKQKSQGQAVRESSHNHNNSNKKKDREREKEAVVEGEILVLPLITRCELFLKLQTSF